MKVERIKCDRCKVLIPDGEPYQSVHWQHDPLQMVEFCEGCAHDYEKHLLPDCKEITEQAESGVRALRHTWMVYGHGNAGAHIKNEMKVDHEHTA